MVARREDTKGIRSFDNVDNVIVNSKASEADQEEQTQEDVEEEDWPPAEGAQRPAGTQHADFSS